MTKKFKIGEYALGGIIEVKVDGDRVSVEALEYVSKKPVPFSKQYFKKVEQTDIYYCLSDMTTHYYADKIMNYIYNK